MKKFKKIVEDYLDEQHFNSTDEEMLFIENLIITLRDIQKEIWEKEQEREEKIREYMLTHTFYSSDSPG